MSDSLYIAWKYLTHNKARTATLVACITLIAVLPVSLELLLQESERQLLSRAESTPLAMGAKGSALDLVMNTLYFADEIPEFINDNCVACMTCVTECPDTAILGKVIEQDTLQTELNLIDNPNEAEFSMSRDPSSIV